MTCPSCGDATSTIGAKVCEACGHPLTPGEAHACESVEPAGASDSGAQPSLCNCPPGASAPDADGYCQNCGIKCVPLAVWATNPLRFAKALSSSFGLASDVGKRHPHNEDFGAIAIGVVDHPVMVVADGVSTSFHSAGASALAVQTITEGLLGASTVEEAKTLMASAIDKADRAIMALPAGDKPSLDPPESTVVAAAVIGDTAVIGWVGDSRAYLVRNCAGGDTGSMEIPLTRDDSWVEMVVASGEFTLEDASKDERAHSVTQVLGMRDEDMKVHVSTASLAMGDTLILCSDGLWNYFQEPGSLARKLQELKSLGFSAVQTCHALVNEANRLGGHDNITVAVLFRP